MSFRSLTPEEQTTLDALNTAVADAVHARRAWLDATMVAISDLRVGDDIYELDTCCCVGTVSAIKRWHRDHDWQYDTSPSGYYEYHTGNHCYDNTSRQLGVSFGSKQDALDTMQFRLRQLSTENPTHA